MITFLLILFCLICFFIVVLVLLQPAHGEGLASAFGGTGTDSFFGTKAIPFFWKCTIALGAGFMILAVVLGLLGHTLQGGIGH